MPSASGQGELTFRDVVQALDAGEPLETTSPAWLLLRDGKVVYTEHRPVVGFDKSSPTCRGT